MIAFIDLKAQFARIQDDVEQAVCAVMRSGQFILGPVVAELEERLARYVGTRHCVSCASGTDALVMALMCRGVGPGDAVFTVPFTFMATAEAIATVGATPIFVDIEPDSYNIDAQALDRAIKALKAGDRSIHPLPGLGQREMESLRPRAVIAVDLFGRTADYRKINQVAAEHGLFVIQDAAQSFGATADNRRAGSMADIGCTSFFPAKPLGCYGDGGAIFVDDADLDGVLRSIRVHGQGSDKYDNVRIGITGRLDAMQAAVLLVKLSIFEDEMAERQRVARNYSAMIADSGLPLVVPTVPETQRSAWAQYTLAAEDGAARDLFMSRLAAMSIPTAIYYRKALHEQEAFAYLGYARGDFPISEDMSERVFSVPMHPYLSDAEIGSIVDAMKGGES